MLQIILFIVVCILRILVIIILFCHCLVVCYFNLLFTFNVCFHLFLDLLFFFSLITIVISHRFSYSSGDGLGHCLGDHLLLHLVLLLPRHPLLPLPLLLLLPRLLLHELRAGSKSLSVAEEEVIIDVFELFHGLNLLKIVKVSCVNHLHPLRKRCVRVSEEGVALVVLHLLHQPPHVPLPSLQLCPLLVHVVDSPEVRDAQLRTDVLLPVEGDEGHLEELLAHEVKRLLDLLNGGRLLLPLLALLPQITSLLSQCWLCETLLVDPLSLPVKLITLLRNCCDWYCSKLHSLRDVSDPDFMVLVCVVPQGEVIGVEDVKDGLLGLLLLLLLHRPVLLIAVVGLSFIFVLFLLKFLIVKCNPKNILSQLPLGVFEDVLSLCFLALDRSTLLIHNESPNVLLIRTTPGTRP